MQQISLFEEDSIVFPTSHDDILKLHAQYLSEGETDPDAFTWSEIKDGRSYFFYGKKVFEHITDSSGKAKLRIQQENGKPVILTSDSPDLLHYLNVLKQTKKNIFRNLITDTFACCNDFNRCSNAFG